MRSKFIYLLVILIMFGGCAIGMDTVRDRATGLQSINQWDRTAFGTNSDRRSYYKCDPEILEPDEHSSLVNTQGKNCKPMEVRYGATSGIVNQVIMPAAVVSAGYFIGDGIKNSGDTINNGSSSSSNQTQKQKQGQYQKQYQPQNNKRWRD